MNTLVPFALDRQIIVERSGNTQDRISRSRLAGDPPDVTINPRVGSIRPFDFHRAEEAIQEGAEATRRHLDDILNTVRSLAV